YRCVDGHDDTSLMCSRCLDDWFVLDAACAECTRAHPVMVPITAAGSFILLAIFAWFYEYKPQGSAFMQSAAFWMQLTSALQDLSIVVGDATQQALKVPGFTALAIEKLVAVYPWVYCCLVSFGVTINCSCL